MRDQPVQKPDQKHGRILVHLLPPIDLVGSIPSVLCHICTSQLTSPHKPAEETSSYLLFITIYLNPLSLCVNSILCSSFSLPLDIIRILACRLLIYTLPNEATVLSLEFILRYKHLQASRSRARRRRHSTKYLPTRLPACLLIACLSITNILPLLFLFPNLCPLSPQILLSADIITPATPRHQLP
ncbi:hypothetical protein GGS24DRAFT_204902 [Hypoxylon argillaceum]|nr:hypothetical protein GGS24DRAFT_204902 [Hypoxylon argillaceum]